MMICLVSSKVLWEHLEMKDSETRILSTPSSCHCCLSQDLTNPCLPSLLLSVSSCARVICHRNSSKRESSHLLSQQEPTLSLDFLIECCRGFHRMWSRISSHFRLAVVVSSRKCSRNRSSAITRDIDAPESTIIVLDRGMVSRLGGLSDVVCVRFSG
jgi:hypothetical protein